MITNLKHGWGKLEFAGFEGYFSYIRNSLPLFLQALQNTVIENEPQAVSFDEEGSEFILVLDEFTSYIISERDSTALYKEEKNIIEIIKEVLEDMNKETVMEWAMSFSVDEEDVNSLNNELMQRLETLEKICEEKRKVYDDI